MSAELFAMESYSHPGVPTAEDIYLAYPLKKHRLYALKCIRAAMKREHPARLLELTQAYAAAVALWPEADRQYTPQASSWFNGGGYEDDPCTWQRNRSNKGRASFA